MRRAMSGALAVLAAIGVAACGPLTESYSETETEQAAIDEIRIAGGSGDVTVTAGAVDRVQITTTVHYAGGRPTASHPVQGRALVLNTRCGNQCRVEYQLTVPASVRVTGNNGSGGVTVDGVASVAVEARSGHVTVRNVRNSVSVTTRSGDIGLHALSGTVVAHARSGDVRGDGLGGGATVTTSSGDVSLAFTRAQNVEVQASSGDVTLTVPAGPYRVQMSAKSGRVRVGVPTQPTGGHLLKVTTHSGDITVRTG
jgi:Toastrack DUF4097